MGAVGVVVGVGVDLAGAGLVDQRHVLGLRHRAGLAGGRLAIDRALAAIGDGRRVGRLQPLHLGEIGARRHAADEGAVLDEPEVDARIGRIGAVGRQILGGRATRLGDRRADGRRAVAGVAGVPARHDRDGKREAVDHRGVDEGLPARPRHEGDLRHRGDRIGAALRRAGRGLLAGLAVLAGAVAPGLRPQRHRRRRHRARDRIGVRGLRRELDDDRVVHPAAGRVHVLLLDPDRLGAEVLHDQRIVRERRRGGEDEGDGGEDAARGSADAR